MEKIRKPPSFKPFDAGRNKLQPPGARGRSAPFSRLKVMPDPQEAARTDPRPAAQTKAKTIPSKAARGDDDLMSLPPQKS